MNINLDVILASIPETFRRPLIDDFMEMEGAHRLGDWEKVGLKVGKICETTYGIVEGLLSGTFASAPAKPTNMVASCIRFENAYPTAARSLRIQIPRLVIAAYELRNNRSIGHVGGDVNPNYMDAELFQRIAKWILGEIVRNVSSLNLAEATKLVEALTQRDHAAIWRHGAIKRVLVDGLSFSQQILVLLYKETDPVSVSAMLKWTEYSNASVFRSKVLGAMHKTRVIEFDKKEDSIFITDKGIRQVEEKRLLDGKVGTTAKKKASPKKRLASSAVTRSRTPKAKVALAKRKKPPAVRARRKK